jgi:hypothetical protein
VTNTSAEQGKDRPDHPGVDTRRMRPWGIGADGRLRLGKRNEAPCEFTRTCGSKGAGSLWSTSPSFYRSATAAKALTRHSDSRDYRRGCTGLPCHGVEV